VQHGTQAETGTTTTTSGSVTRFAGFCGAQTALDSSTHMVGAELCWVPVCLNLGFLRFLPLDLLPFLDCGDPAKMEDTSLCFEAGRFRFWVKWEIQMILRFVNCMCGERGGYLDSITIGKCF